MILLLLLSVIILLLCFTPKEGFYNDKDTYAAKSSIDKLKGKAEKLRNTINSISKADLGTSEIASNLRPILDTNKDALFKNGVVKYVKDVTEKLAKLQLDSEAIDRLLESLKDYNILITAHIENLDDIKSLLNKIPDS
jgi:gas vesicle protein